MHGIRFVEDIHEKTRVLVFFNTCIFTENQKWEIWAGHYPVEFVRLHT